MYKSLFEAPSGYRHGLKLLLSDGRKITVIGTATDKYERLDGHFRRLVITDAGENIWVADPHLEVFAEFICMMEVDDE